MCCPFGSRRLALLAPLFVALSLTACSRSAAESGATGTSGNTDGPFVVGFEPTYITIENRTGSPIVDGQVEIILTGPRPPFRAYLSRIENMNKTNVAFREFLGIDGTEYSRRLAKARRVRIKATDVAGRAYEMEVPFQ